MNEIPNKIAWKISVPIFHNYIILKQLALALGIPFGLLALFLLVIKAYNGFLLMAILFLATYVFIRIVWGGNYHVGFELNANGMHTYTMKQQAKQNRIINGATVLLGFISGKPTVAGAGFLAQSKQDITIPWRNIKKVTYLPKKHTVMIKSGFTETIAIFCTKENYADVEVYIRSRMQEQEFK